MRALVLLMIAGCVMSADTALDEIAKPAERKLYLEIWKERTPLKRRSLATKFLNEFPASALLAQVLEAASKSSIELGDHTAALYYGRQSLRIYPENPLLLAPLSVVLANRGDNKTAAIYASEAREYFARFAAPAGMKEKDWPRATPHTSGKPEPASAYAGSAACQTCHTEQFENWRRTGMARMLQPITADRIIGDFRNALHADGAARVSGEGRNFFIDLRRTSGNWDRYRIDFTVGSKWQQAYVTRSSSGELHVLPLQYNRLEKAWINYWRIIDPPASERAVTGEFHRLRDITSYEQNCAPCHTSQLRHNAFAEPGVNCEMCHGPSAAHAKGAAPSSRFASVNNRQYVEVCAQCHAQSAIREPQSFPPRYKRRPYSEYSRRAFYRDGRFRETTFIVEAFERSACFRKGGAHCGNCHNPHPVNPESNPVSLKHAPDSDAMCLGCHSPSFADGAHTKHESASEGARCVSCHMPKIANSLLFKARTHQIDDKPDAAMTARFGPEESPNACLLCHTDRNSQWLAAQLRSW